MTAITALTAQNTTGVYAISEVTPEFLKQQLDAVFTDIFPDAVKIGMTASSPLIQTIADCLKHYHAKNIVTDPVMVATSGSKLIDEKAVDTLKKELLPITTLLTPNIPEAEILSGIPIHSEEDMLKAAKQISETYSCAVLCKGGHNTCDANDLLYENNTPHWFTANRINTNNTHGTGCTLSSAIASNLAKGYSLHESIKYAKTYITAALSTSLNLGHGSGPLNHMHPLTTN